MSVIDYALVSPCGLFTEPVLPCRGMRLREETIDSDHLARRTQQCYPITLTVVERDGELRLHWPLVLK